MHRINKHIKNTKHLLLLWLVLFALSPCTVKEVLFDSVAIDYLKPFNKAKTASSTSLCVHSLNEGLQSSVVKQAKNKQAVEPMGFSARPYCAVSFSSLYNHYSKTFSGNSPPKYILYKRLKLDVA